MTVLRQDIGDTTGALDKAGSAHGVLQRPLSDNGAALHPTQRGVLGRLVVRAKERGTEPITGTPYRPTT